MGKETIVAITDGGGRGAALVEAYARSPHVDRILAFPGNRMMSLVSHGKPVEVFPKIKTTSLKEIIEVCDEKGVALLDVCQDNAIEAGLVDAAQKAGILTIGPTREAGRIEWSKFDARMLGSKVGLNQPNWIWCCTPEAGIDYINQHLPEDRWIKANWLAAGKGAKPARSKAEALRRIAEMGELGEAGKSFLIEEWIRNDDGTPGEEFSHFVLCRGRDFTYLGSAQDNKPVGNRDEGENTGGMGGHSEPEVFDGDIKTKATREIIDPILKRLAEEGRPYSGVLYFSGMKVHRGGEYVPYAIEFNARWGDPEAQVILPGITSDWFEVGMNVAESSSLKRLHVERDDKKRVVITVASLGYPGDYSDVVGKEIYGIQEAMDLDGVRVYGAGVQYDGKTFRANGGRLLYVVGEGPDIEIARGNAYAGASRIIVEGNNQHYRDDIAIRDLFRHYQSKKSN